MARKKELDKLSQDAAAAKAAGMSYGKWKAMQGEQPIRKDPEVPETWKICQYCSKPFKPTTKRPQLYCEAYCGTRAYYERERLKRNQGSKSNLDHGMPMPELQKEDKC